MTTIRWNPEAEVQAILFVDAIDASLYDAISKFGEVRDADKGQQMVILNGAFVGANTIQLPDGTDIDIVRCCGLVHLQDWHNHIEFED